MKTPCEHAVWEVLPKIRASIAWVMVREYRLRAHQVSECLGVSDAAVSQYLSGKRGKIITDERVMAVIRTTVEAALNRENHEIVPDELCVICRTYRNVDVDQAAPL